MYVVSINNIMGIEEAILPLDGTTVIGGYNSTQKSIIMKLAYAILRGYKECISLATKFKGVNAIKKTYEIPISNWTSIESDLKSDRINGSETRRLVRIISTEFYKTFGLNLYDHLTSTSSIDISEILDNCSSVLFSVTRSHIIFNKVLEFNPRNVLYLSSTSILDFYKCLVSGCCTGQDADREICGKLITKNYVYEEVDKNSLEVIDYTIPIKVNDMGNVHILEDDKYLPVSLAGNGIRLSSILTNLITFGYLKDCNDYIFIDNPENGVNPELQNYLGTAFGKAEYNIILTTHSPYLVSSLNCFNTNYLITNKDNGQCSLDWKDDCTELLKMLSEPILGI